MPFGLNNAPEALQGELPGIWPALVDGQLASHPPALAATGSKMDCPLSVVSDGSSGGIRRRMRVLLSTPPVASPILLNEGGDVKTISLGCDL